MTEYTATKTGNRLERRENQFFYRGRYFPGLVDVEVSALYDHPGDSFNEHVGLPTGLDQGLIEMHRPRD